MKKFPRLGIACLLVAVFLTQDSVTAQQVILINGEPTEVILNGEDIKSIVTTQLKNYMQEYGQETDDEFVKSLIKIPTPEAIEKPKPLAVSTSRYRKKSIQEVKESAMVLASYPRREK